MPPSDRFGRVGVSLLVVCLCSVAGAGENWPRFRGPNGTATAGPAGGKSIPSKWTDRNYNWKIALPGSGHSSPVIWGGKIFLTCADAATAKRTVCSVRAKDGKVLWKREYPGQKHRSHRDNSYASSSPAADADHVYAYWADPDKVTLLALTHDGKDVWQRDLGPYNSKFGGGTSPIVYQDMVIVNNDQAGESFLLAVDARTGKDRWRTPRATTKVPYSTPLVYTVAGDKPQLIFCSTRHGFSGVDPATGKALWHFGGPLNEQIRPVASPVAAGDVVLASWGKGGAGWDGLAVRPGTTDGKVKPTLACKLAKPIHYSPTPVATDKRIFACTDGGEIQCLDAATGKKIWAHKETGGFYGSPVLVDGRVFVITKKGVMVVFAAADTFQLQGRTDLGEKSFATPAVVDGVMYIRTLTHLMSLGGKSA